MDKSANFQTPFTDSCPKLEEHNFYVQVASSFFSTHWDSGTTLGQAKDVAEQGKPKYALIRDVEDYQPSMYEKRLPCFGCGVGWFSFLLGFLFPPMWYYATFLYFGNYYRKDPRERAGLAASAITALGCSIVVLIVLLIRMLTFSSTSM